MLKGKDFSESFFSWPGICDIFTVLFIKLETLLTCFVFRKLTWKWSDNIKKIKISK